MDSNSHANSPATKLTTSEYRPDVDGLRAVAALAVVGAHAGWLRGGGHGVDVFFVISGFLISQLILRAIEHGTFSFVEFYARRVKRIFPALVALLLVVAAVGCTVLSPEHQARLGRDIAAGAGFLENFWFYFTFAERNSTPDYLLTHLWTLGIEEQFYLLWPLFIWFAGSRGRRPLALIAMLATISFASYAWMSSFDSIAAWLLPWNRLWELAIGGGLAYAQLRAHAPPRHARLTSTVHLSGVSRFGLSQQLSIVGAACLIASLCDLMPAQTWPGSYVLLPAVGAFLLIAAGPQSWINRHVLSARPMVLIGLISYPLYLWHVSLFVIAAIIHHPQSLSELELPLLWKMTVIAASLFLSYCTYKYVEKPIRSSTHTRRSATILCSIMALCGGSAYLYFA